MKNNSMLKEIIVGFTGTMMAFGCMCFGYSMTNPTQNNILSTYIAQEVPKQQEIKVQSEEQVKEPVKETSKETIKPSSGNSELKEAAKSTSKELEKPKINNNSNSKKDSNIETKKPSNSKTYYVGSSEKAKKFHSKPNCGNGKNMRPVEANPTQNEKCKNCH